MMNILVAGCKVIKNSNTSEEKNREMVAIWFSGPCQFTKQSITSRAVESSGMLGHICTSRCKQMYGSSARVSLGTVVFTGLEVCRLGLPFLWPCRRLTDEP